MDDCLAVPGFMGISMVWWHCSGSLACALFFFSLELFRSLSVSAKKLSVRTGNTRNQRLLQSVDMVTGRFRLESSAVD